MNGDLELLFGMLLVVPNSNSSMIHIAAKVLFRLNNQSVGSTYFLLQQPMEWRFGIVI
jgi:hypothetical protein